MTRAVLPDVRAARIATLTSAGWSAKGAERVEQSGVRIGLAASAMRLAATRYPVAGGAAERYALWLIGHPT